MNPWTVSLLLKTLITIARETSKDTDAKYEKAEKKVPAKDEKI
jgi:hypothetical protein